MYLKLEDKKEEKNYVLNLMWDRKYVISGPCLFKRECG